MSELPNIYRCDVHNRVICTVKEMKSWVYFQTLSLRELTQSYASFLNAHITIHKEQCCAVKNRFSSLSYWDGWTKLGLHKPIWDLERRVPYAYPILDPKILSKLER